MSRRTVAVFVGTRPEAIKMAPVVAALRAEAGVQCRVVATGQHREMFRQIAEELDLQVDADLEVMRPAQTLAGLTARLLEAVDAWVEANRPDLALVQGDTTTVLATALACFYRRIPVGHVEAGLRTGNVASPFPEEANRRLASRIASLHFAPTPSAREALLREGVPDASIEVTGNTVVDALAMEVARQAAPGARAEVHASLVPLLGPDWAEVPFLLVTGHRRENFGPGLREICEAIAILAARHPDHRFVYPVHLNPEVKTQVGERLGGVGNVRLLPPLGYRAFVALLARCRLVLTDSGGVQEEAPSLGKPVLVLRDTTERPEGVAAGAARLVGPHTAGIVAETSRLLEDREAYRAMASVANPYGDGHAAGRIVARILRELG
jgi:UDP-N-acetylglucosamine 2-epimerase (non-hydrolysing)